MSPGAADGPQSAEFPRDCRLLDAQAFKRVFERPQRYAAEGYLVLVRGSTADRARLGLAISKKCARRAVDRNRLKRLARESFRLAAHRLPAVDVVVLCSKGATRLPSRRLRSTLDQVWTRIGSATWAASSSD